MYNVRMTLRADDPYEAKIGDKVCSDSRDDLTIIGIVSYREYDNNTLTNSFKEWMLRVEGHVERYHEHLYEIGAMSVGPKKHYILHT
jgi:hypothetical protein